MSNKPNDGRWAILIVSFAQGPSTVSQASLTVFEDKKLSGLVWSDFYGKREAWNSCCTTILSFIFFHLDFVEKQPEKVFLCVFFGSKFELFCCNWKTPLGAFFI